MFTSSPRVSMVMLIATAALLAVTSLSVNAAVHYQTITEELLQQPPQYQEPAAVPSRKKEGTPPPQKPTPPTAHGRKPMADHHANRLEQERQKRVKLLKAAADRKERTIEEIRLHNDELKKEELRQKQELHQAMRTGKTKDDGDHTHYDPYFDHKLHDEQQRRPQDHDVHEEDPARPHPPEPVIDLARYQKGFTDTVIEHHEGYFATYAYSSEECEMCDDELLEDFIQACEYHAEEEFIHPKRKRLLRYGYIDVSKNRSIWEDMQRYHPHEEKWTLPLFVMLNVRESAHGSHHAHIFHPRHSHVDTNRSTTSKSRSLSATDDGEVTNEDGDLRREHRNSQFYRDILHYMHRARSHDMHNIASEADLMYSLYELPNDGVAVMLMHESVEFRERHSRAEYWFEQVLHEERFNLHFLVFRDMNVWADEHERTGPQFPYNHSWREKYNPTDADLVAFAIDENDPESFSVHPYNFPNVEAKRTAMMEKRGPYNADFDDFEQLHHLRLWIDRIKTHRHTKTNRRFTNVLKRHVIHKAGRKHEDCVGRHGVHKGDTVRVDVRGIETESGRVFLDRVGDVVVAGDSIAHLPPYMHDFMLGWCENTEHEVFSPAHEGFHAELYEIKIHDIIEHHHKKAKKAQQQKHAEEGHIRLDNDESAEQLEARLKREGLEKEISKTHYLEPSEVIQLHEEDL